MTIHDKDDRRVCPECVSEEFLSTRIENEGVTGTCFYCTLDGKTLSVIEIAESVGSVLDDCYSPVEPPRGQPVGVIIADLLTSHEELAEDIRTVLGVRISAEWPGWDTENNPFDPTATYARNDAVDIWKLEIGWRDFEKKMKTESRYFNRYAEDWLSGLFAGIDEYRTHSGKPLILDAGTGTDITRFYRARVFQSKRKLRHAMKRPDAKMGPPAGFRARAGRMNAAGISVFYGATEGDIAIAEVRPPVGSKVLVACFQIIRPLKLLNLVDIKEISNEQGSLFDEKHRRRLKQIEFLRGIGQRLSKAVLPNDEDVDYLPTQVIADYLATAVSPEIDGIIYPSAQIGNDGRAVSGGLLRRRGDYRCNVVLFHKAAQVQRLETDAEVSVTDNSLSGLSGFLNNGPYDEYTVWEDAKQAAETGPSTDASLKYVSPLYVHYVEAVTVKTHHSEVFRLPKSGSKISEQ